MVQEINFTGNLECDNGDDKSLKDSGLLILCKHRKWNKIIKRRIGILSANLLRNMIAEKGVIRAGQDF